MNELPPHLRTALNRGHAAREVALLVPQFEANDVLVKVVRLQLGDPGAEGFGQQKVVYQTRQEQEPR